MTSHANKFGFYSALYLDYAGIRSGSFQEPDDSTFGTGEPLKKSLRVHFWTPARTQGAVVTVYDMLPAFEALQRELGLQWNVTAAQTLPEDRCDWLVCFKAVPDPATTQQHGRTAMLICDQAEAFWNALPDFDLQVATSSRPFASVVARANKHTYFIGETEPKVYIDSGTSALRSIPPSQRGPVLMWHGGGQSKDALDALRPGLERLAESTKLELHIVSGQKPERLDHWGKLPVRFLPWSVEMLQRTAAGARLGIIPARAGARVSYLKPASRIRCLYALGVPAIGDRRVPDAVQFAERFGGPLAHGETEWMQRIEQLLHAPQQLDEIARAGHHEVAANFSTRNMAARWIRLLGALT